jgi:putative hydrolase of the HAD superfamily
MMSRVADIEWIAFDAVGTLIFADPPAAAVYHQIGRQYGSRLTLNEVERLFSEAFARHARTGELASSEAIEREFWRMVVGEVLDDVENFAACFVELHAWFAKPIAWRCFPDVGATLEVLHARGYRLALASNFDGRLHSVREGLPELEPIERCVVSSEAGWRKPHAGFFAALQRACGSQAEQILMVGDDLEGDVRGAQRAGLPARLFMRDPAAQTEIDPAITLRTLPELIDALDRIRSGGCQPPA